MRYGGCEVVAVPSLLFGERFIVYCPYNVIDVVEKAVVDRHKGPRAAAPALRPRGTNQTGDDSMPRSETKPIECTLTPDDFKSRLAWIAELTRDALREHRRDDLVLELAYAPEAVHRVREMVRREQACCAFLAFDLREEPDAVRLTVAAPEDARAAADTLFEQFVAMANAGVGGQRLPSVGQAQGSTAVR